MVRRCRGRNADSAFTSTNFRDVSQMSDLKVRVHGSVAIVTGAYYEKGTSKGKSYEFHDRLTDIWMNSGKRWQLIASHYSIVAK